MAKLKRLDAFDESVLWQRIESYPSSAEEKKAVSHLAASVREVVEQAAFIGSLIVRHMPQYTLHNDRHFLNVLGIMDALVPEETLQQLHPLECALCILAAYTHDLGMALSDEEHAQLLDPESPEGQHYQRFREGFSEEIRQIERWEGIGGNEAHHRVGLLEGHILSSYLRQRHTESSHIAAKLEAIKNEVGDERLFQYGGYDYEHELALISASHGYPTDWLRRELAREDADDDAFFRFVGMQERVNLCYPALLLRLADIMDFDVSRTPHILFKHIGIENKQSVLEWSKHLAVTGWGFSDEELRYDAACIHPVHHRTILEFVGWIEAEVRNVRSEWAIQGRHLPEDARPYDLRLPAEIKANVKPRRVGGTPCYQYLDAEFQLDKEQVLQLLMGESLYGDPSLCIRELLQNALDAVQMRDLRLKDREPMEPVDTLQDGEALEVEVEWGVDEESGQEFVLVRDHGIGMTKSDIERYFTQVGKSYYRSEAFARERAHLRDQDFFATPISQFGIGILSCFMIADRMEVRTRPGGTNAHERAPYDVSISGPGSLFWLREGTLDHQGTEVKLFLKERFHVSHDPDTLLDRLRKAFEYPTEYSSSVFGDETAVDPAFVAGRYVVWPLYPIRLHAPDGPALTIDDRLHPEILAPIDPKKVAKKAAQWGVPTEQLGSPAWRCLDWVDAGEGRTGSRVRLWIPQSIVGDPPFADPVADINVIPQDELAAFVETQLESRLRTALLVRGMYVDNVKASTLALQLVAGGGTRVWLDLRGDVAPPLRASREATLPPGDADLWHSAMRDLLRRMLDALLHDATLSRVRNTRTGLRHPDLLSLDTTAKSPENLLVPPAFSLFVESQFTLSLARDRALYRALYRSGALPRALDFDRGAHDRFFDRALDRGRALVRANALDRAHNLARARARTLAGARPHARPLARALNLDHARTRAHAVLTPHLLGANLQDAFFPSLERSWPYLECFTLRGQIGDALLTSPGTVQFETESDGRTVHFADPEGLAPPLLAARGYDLCFPMVAVPLGALRRTFRLWRTDQRYRPLGVAPFLFPELDAIWPRHSKILNRLFPFGSLYALLPDPRLWYTPFDEWSDEDWSTGGYSALWDITTGDVLWAEGAYPREEMRSIGRSFFEVFPEAQRER